MNKSVFITILVLPFLFSQQSKAQDVYAISSWENLFQWADVERGTENINEQLRYTIAFNMGQYWHVDFSNAIGLYSGLALRNVGFIYDSPDIPTKTIRRSYNLGVPLALKLGSFSNHFYIFGGGEYELLFHYKGKRWDSNDRDGTKHKDSEWFSSKTKRFVPSVFAGLQLPGGINLKFKYYLDHFLNLDYTGNDLGQNVSFSDYTKINMYYISVCWQFRTDQWKKYVPVDDKVAHNF